MLQQFEISQQIIALLLFLAAIVVLLVLALRLRKKKTEAARGKQKVSYVDKIKHGLSKTRQSFLINTGQLFGGRKVDNALLEELEESLILADLGPQASGAITEAVRAKVKTQNGNNPELIKTTLKEELLNLLADNTNQFATITDKPYVILIVGVNGSGKTTSTGKLAKLLSDKGLSVLVAAADTFRAAAIEQLEIWAERASCQLVKHRPGADPAAVAYDAVVAAKSRSIDVVLIDTAGRLHTKTNLMEELKKIKRVITKEIPQAPHEVLLVVDATSGQNVLQQARLFNDAVSLTGIILTKLDGTAKGGIVVAVKTELGLPVKLIGVGEGVDDLRPFSAQEFVNALFE
jgi:fused signal recognition particle receptor